MDNVSKMHKRVNISLGEELFERIEEERGDVSRSRFLEKVIERAYNGGKKKA